MTSFLLDTHTFLWWVEGSARLTKKAHKAIANPNHRCFLSLASIWEMSIKISLGKLKLAASLKNFVPEQMSANAFEQLPIEFRHVVRVENMPFHHKDPFDRMIAAQALEEHMTVISADPIFEKYKVPRLW